MRSTVFLYYDFVIKYNIKVQVTAFYQLIFSFYHFSFMFLFKQIPMMYIHVNMKQDTQRSLLVLDLFIYFC